MNRLVEKTFFSIVIPTINSPFYFKKLISKLLSQKKGNFKFEIIIIYQGEKKNSSYIKNQKKITVIHSKKKGLSLAKNKGIKRSHGNYLIFLDDDVAVESNFLINVKKTIDSKSQCPLIFGNILIKNTKKNFKKIMFLKNKYINIFNYENCLASAMIMKKKNKMFFDNNFGLGAKFYSSEETDIVLRFLELKLKVFFTPSIKIFHPKIENIDLKKFISYGKGNIRLLKKHYKRRPVFIFFIISSILKSIILTLYSILKLDLINLKKHFYLLKGKLLSLLNVK